MRTSQPIFLACTLCACLAAACGGSTSSGVSPPSGDDAGSGDDAASASDGRGGDAAEGGSDTGGGTTPYPAFTPTDVPQVVTLRGPVLKSPKIIPVFFSTDDPTTVASLTDFVNRVGQTQYWSAIVSEYGVGPATGEPAIQLTSADDPAATIDDGTIQQWLYYKINNADPGFGSPDANTLFALFYPAGVTITRSGPGDASCTSFGGYHSSVPVGSQDVAYAVLPRCPNFGAALGGLDAVTGPASHEFAEGATDPYPGGGSNNPAYSNVDAAHGYWSRLYGGGEIGDMCAQNQNAFLKFSEIPYVVQRCWSNKAAKAGQDPCVPPMPGEVYFSTFPVMNDAIPSTSYGGPVTYKGVHIPVGQSATVELDLFSNAAVTGMQYPADAEWSIDALDINVLQNASPLLKYKFDRLKGKNGDKIHMTITVLAAGTHNIEPFLLTSKLSCTTCPLGSQESDWAGVVGN